MLRSMSRVIAEYELPDVKERTLSWGEAWRSFPWMWCVRTLIKPKMFFIFLIIGALYMEELSVLRDAQEEYVTYVMECFMYVPEEAVADMEYAAAELADKAESVQFILSLLVQVCCIILLMLLFKLASGICIAARMPYSVLMGLGLESVNVMRLTSKGGLLVGRDTGVRMRFSWACFTSARVFSSFLVLKMKNGSFSRLPLPELSPDEQRRLQSELDAVFAAPTGDPTSPPADAVLWKGYKPADTLMLEPHYRRSRMRAARRWMLMVWVALVVPMMIGIWSMGYDPRLVFLYVVVWCILLVRNLSILPLQGKWHYKLGQSRYTLYLPNGGVCSVPRALLQEVVQIYKMYLLRVRGDDYALFPCTGADAAGLPLVNCTPSSRRLMLWWWLVYSLIVALYWRQIYGFIHDLDSLIFG